MIPPAAPAGGSSATASAPGRLDLLGGVADYSGSRVLELPLAAGTTVTVTALTDPWLALVSAGEAPAKLSAAALDAPLRAGADGAALRSALLAAGAPRWALYVLGCLAWHRREHGLAPAPGYAFEISSTVPAGSGVSSSAALEVATLRALDGLHGTRLAGTGRARLAQRVENEVVGAPCGLMDQLASDLGVPGQLLPILCRPDLVGEPLPLPAGVIAVGWPSGVKHSVGGDAYGRARAAAFMGRALLARKLGADPGHAAAWAPSLLRRHAAALPGRLLGADFLATGLPTLDPLSRVEADVVYPVLASLAFAAEENERVAQAEAMLRAASAPGTRPELVEELLQRVGELLFQSHEGYGAMGLGCPETDAMVDAVRGRGPARGFYGARVSGGGSGGTVAVLLRASALDELQALAGTALLR